jgi:hypothetical protein
MLTKATNLVQREVNPVIKSNLDSFANVLEEVVNFGSTIMFSEIRTKPEGEESIPAIMLFRHYLDIVDSISILVRSGCGDTSKILIRAAFETKLFLEYLFEKETDNRSRAYLVMDIISQLEKVKKILPSSPEGKEFYKNLNDEGFFKDLEIPESSLIEIESFIRDKEKLLHSHPYQIAYKEYLRLRNKVRFPNWYEFYNGPKSLKQLSTYLNQSSAYKLMYNEWSGAVHATDIYRGKVSKSEVPNMSNFVQLRYFKDVQEIVKHSITQSLKLFRLYIDSRTPEKQAAFKTWYIRCKPTFDDLFLINYINCH